MRHGATSALTVLVAAGVLAMPLGLAVSARSGDSPLVSGAPSAVSASSTRVPGPDRCGPEPHDAAGWSRLFDRLDGRVLWLFGDTVTGGVDPSGRRVGATLVRNSVLVTRGTCVTSVASRREALPAPSGSWLWPTHAVVTRAGSPSASTDVLVLAQRMVRTGPGAWDFRRVSTAAVGLTVAWNGALRVGPSRDIARGDILWGAALVARGAWTYLYGTREGTPGIFGRDLLLARAPTRGVSDVRTWRYRTARGWSARRADAAVVRPASLGVSTVPSAALVAGRWVIVTKPQEFVDDRVVVLDSARPWGPWEQRTLFTAPSTRVRPRYSPALVAGATAHHAVVVVNRTTTSLPELLARADVARPTFHDVRLLA